MNTTGLRNLVILSVLLSGLVSACGSTPTARPALTVAPYREVLQSFPVTDDTGAIRNLNTRLCIPNTSAGPFPVAVLNHGSPPDPNDRPKMKPYSCESEQAQWFLKRGYLVASPQRRGYGATGGTWDESYGPCDAANYVKAGLQTARDMNAAVEGLSQLPEAKPDAMLVVGQSAGGFGTLAYNSVPHPRVSAFINMSGGRGGHKGGVANAVCSPENLIQAAKTFGSTATTRMLWIYTENDTYFDPGLAKSLHDAYSEGGAPITFLQKAAFGQDGHMIFGARGGSAIWGPEFESFLGQTSI